jgi:phospholipase C
MKVKASDVSALSPVIDHVVIIVKENHTFDNYFGTYPGTEGDGNLGKALNPPTSDPNHRHEAWMARANDTHHKVQYSKGDIPTYFALADQYTLCDHYFSEVAGPSTPNHLMLITADSPVINNPKNMYHPSPSDVYSLTSLPGALEKAGLTWGNYGGYAFHYVAELAQHGNNYTRDLFVHDAAAGRLPSVSWLYGDGRPPYSEHPLENVTAGSEWTGEAIQAIVDGGLWGRTVVFITWDDWGGWYDHVTPPNLEKWNSSMAQRPADAFPQFNGQQFRYGSRVPCLVVSPYAKPGYVSKVQHSHISLVKFCETLLGIASINARLDKADDMSDCFDATQKPLGPPKLPPPTILTPAGGGGAGPVGGGSVGRHGRHGGGGTTPPVHPPKHPKKKAPARGRASGKPRR